MEALSTIPVAAIVAFLTSLAGVWFADWIGFRRDREKLRLELDWKMQERRLNSLLTLLENTPLLSAHPREVVNSIQELCIWVEHRAEPWLNAEQAEHLRKLREPVSEWLFDIHSSLTASEKPNVPDNSVPTSAVNALRREVIVSIKQALSDLTFKSNEITKKSAW